MDSIRRADHVCSVADWGTRDCILGHEHSFVPVHQVQLVFSVQDPARLLHCVGRNVFKKYSDLAIQHCTCAGKNPDAALVWGSILKVVSSHLLQPVLAYVLYPLSVRLGSSADMDKLPSLYHFLFQVTGADSFSLFLSVSSFSSFFTFYCQSLLFFVLLLLLLPPPLLPLLLSTSLPFLSSFAPDLIVNHAGSFSLPFFQ